MTTDATNLAPPAESSVSDVRRGFILFHRYRRLPEAIQEALTEAEVLSGINRMELRMRLTGVGIGAIAINRPMDAVIQCAADLNGLGLKTAVMEKEAVRKTRLPVAAKKIRLGPSSLDFEDGDDKILFRITPQTDLLIIVTDLSGQTVRQRMTAMACLETALPQGFGSSLKKIAVAKPAAVFYALNQTPVSGVYVDTATFSFMGLNERLTPARGTNFRVMIEEAMRIARTSVTDDNFGLALLPGASPDWKGSESAIERELGRYAGYVIAAAQAKIVPQDLETEGKPQPLKNPADRLDGDGPEAIATVAALQPPPDVTHSRLVSLFQASLPEIIMGLVVLIMPFSLFTSGAETVSRHPLFFQTLLGIAMTIAGFGMCCYALVMLHYRRMVENTPTSRIRSLSMGMVELSGKTRRYYDLRTSATRTPCVFYHCRYYQYKKTGDSAHWVLSRSVSSGKIPFYIEDDTGRVLVNPKGASFAISLAVQSFSGGYIPSLSLQLHDPNKKVTEALIAEGVRVYVLGSAKINRQGQDAKARIIDKLRLLKQKPEALKAYDANGDGQVDAQEWESARNDAAMQVYSESLTEQSENTETVVIQKPLYGLLPFIVADSERGLVRQLMFRTLIFLAGGIITMGFSIRFIGNLLK